MRAIQWRLALKSAVPTEFADRSGDRTKKWPCLHDAFYVNSKRSVFTDVPSERRPTFGKPVVLVGFRKLRPNTTHAKSTT